MRSPHYIGGGSRMRKSFSCFVRHAEAVRVGSFSGWARMTGAQLAGVCSSILVHNASATGLEDDPAALVANLRHAAQRPSDLSHLELGQHVPVFIRHHLELALALTSIAYDTRTLL